MEWLSIILALLILGIVITFHEFGHFLLGKLNGFQVIEFSVGMGPRILSRVKGDTRYSLRLIPIGGSCAFGGEDEDDTSEGAFNTKPVWQRFLVIAAGPVFNFILAFFGAAIVIGIVGYDPPQIMQVAEGSPEAEAGLKAGDIVTRFDGHRIYLGRDLYAVLTLDGLEEHDTEIQVLRDGEKITLHYQPEAERRYMLGFTYNVTEEAPVIQELTLGGVLEKAGLRAGDTFYSINGHEIENGIALTEYFEEYPMDGQEMTITYLRDGLTYDVEVTPKYVDYISENFSYNLGREKVGPLGVIKYSALEVRYWISTTLKTFKMLFTGKLGVDSLSGPVGVVSVIGDAYQESKSEGALVTWLTMLNFLILISANLGVMNLLPLPALDGGRIIFLIIEGIRRKPINRNAEGYIHFVGLVVLMILVLFVTMKDIYRLF